MAGLTGPRWRRALLTLVVAGVHLVLLDEVARSRLGEGSGQKLPKRIEVAFVRELAQAAAPEAPPPPAPAPAPAPARLPAVAKAAAQPASAAASAAMAASAAVAATADATAASAPAAAASVPAEAAQALAAAPALEPQAPAVAAQPPVPARLPASGPLPTPAPASNPLPVPWGATSTPPPTAAAPAAANRFDWPPSTQLNFNLNGNYRGPVQGSARVEWLRDGSQYQVRMESSAGPLFKRSGISEGELGELGLAPRRFTGEQRVLFGSARRWQLSFGPERVKLSNGREVPAMPGAQDEASQYVQLTWLFTMQPDKLRVGQSVDIPLALNSKLERWTYDIVEEERLRLPFGEVPTFHVKPRREASGGDLTAEIWIAPTLQYLPVRILLRQSAEVWVDLTLEKPPLQATGPR